ncbi:Leucine-rich repeat-containing protein 4 [Echinococcus granulosus]|uniref:Leucine rich repeat containing protein 4 n=1 Tax=Echinococcus granulosus TaxID=6210 RepID=U6J042_ECHGR|nr:Leucine-rich repeat-containing protein [Echinococcus granulosus]EUB64480.1 Leucine-rich repeat-containing protein [Echinococcus granulosus]KAH9286700.1 Leucine-rich repeat-containing protein 4 [Echinococcus granulosus]CDS16666.1 leucine rich repeat containing protein 4 [Echinococcus granulosus]
MPASPVCYCCSVDFLLILTALVIIPFVRATHCQPQVDIHLLNCSGGGLTRVPHRVHPETRTLDLSDNHLKVLHEDSFGEYHRLSQLILDHNHIYKITDKAMNTISTTLRHLSLRGNQLSIRASSNFPVSALTKLRNLRVLDLSENPLGVIFTNWLAPLGVTLRILRLSSLVGQVELQDKGFFGLGRLEEFDFSNNSLYHLPENAFFGIRPEKLKRLNLRNIPWHCDCKLLWLRQWLSGVKITTPPHEPDITGPCSYSHKFTTVPLIRLPISHFQCPPKLQSMHSSAPHYFAKQKDLMHVSPSVGESVTLTCTFVSQPKMLVQWYRNGALLRPELKRFEQSVNKGSKFSAVLTISALRAPVDNGNYTCKTSNNRGTAKGVFFLKIFNSASDSKYLLDEAQPSAARHTPRDESQLPEAPRILVTSFAVVCVCVICGAGLLVVLLLFHIRNGRTRIQCHNAAQMATETFENVLCFEPPPPPPPQPAYKSSLLCSPPSVLEIGLNNCIFKPPVAQPDDTPNLSYSQAYKISKYTSSTKVDKSTTEERDKPIVRTFAPFMTSSESEGDDEDAEGGSKSSDGVDKACPVHGRCAKEEALFCPVHSHSFLGSVAPRPSASFSSKDIFTGSISVDTKQQWRTLEGQGKCSGMNGGLLRRRINSATTDLSSLKC